MFKSRAISNRFLHLQKNVAKTSRKLLGGGGLQPAQASPLGLFIWKRVSSLAGLLVKRDSFWLPLYE